MIEVSDYKINLHTWFIDRELDFLPKHFIISKTQITHESKVWILENLKGRFCIVSYIDERRPFDVFSFLPNDYPAFEDPQEAILYELKYS